LLVAEMFAFAIRLAIPGVRPDASKKVLEPTQLTFIIGKTVDLRTYTCTCISQGPRKQYIDFGAAVELTMADQRNQDIRYYQVPQQPSSPFESGTKTTNQKNAHQFEVLEDQFPHTDFQTNGHNLFSLRSLDYLLVYIPVISIYTITVLAVIVWMTSGPALSGGGRVLKTGTLYVDQFYSGLALSALLAPAAIIIRTMSHDLGLIHPFSIAYRKPVR
jgi:hypothetical protein